MAKLTTEERKRIPGKEFVFPGKRKFPIEDRAHAANAKSRASAIGGEVKRKVDAAVARKYPGMGKKGKTTSLGAAMMEK